MILTNVPSDLDFPYDVFQLPAGIRRADYGGLGLSISPRAGRSRVGKDTGCVYMVKENRTTASGMIPLPLQGPVNGLPVPITNGETVSST